MAKQREKNKRPEIIMEYDFDGVEEKKEEVEKKPAPKVVIEEEKGKKKKVKSKSKPKVKTKPKQEKKKPVFKKKETKKEKKKRVKKEKKEEIKERIEAPVDDVIQALLDSEKTFVGNITSKAKKSIFSSFYPFPKNISMMSIGNDEAVVLIVRKHWSGLIPKLLLAFFTMFAPFLISFAVPTWFEGVFGSLFFSTGLFIFFLMLSTSILVDAFLKWFFQMNIVTTKRIIDIDFVSITTHRVSETTFDQVQDVSHSPAGPLASFFDYGNICVQTAGSKSEFEFDNVPRPRDIQDTILDLRELRRKKTYKY